MTPMWSKVKRPRLATRENWSINEIDSRTIEAYRAVADTANGQIVFAHLHQITGSGAYHAGMTEGDMGYIMGAQAVWDTIKRALSVTDKQLNQMRESENE